jgi:hypothetical protein
LKVELREKDEKILGLKSDLDISADMVNKLKLEVDMKNKEIFSAKDKVKNMA